MSKSDPKILYLDIETNANKVYAFDLFSYKSAQMIIQEKSIISFAYKWAGEKKAKAISILDYRQKGKEFDPYDDRALVKDIIDVINEADYVVAHFGDKFDMRFIRARAVINDLPAPAPVAQIDTYKLVKKHFHLNANRLDYLGKLFGFGGKIPMNWSYWQRCAEGDIKAIQHMVTYNKHDVELLEKVFLHILPHVSTRLNFNLFGKKEVHVCPTCGGTHLQKRGTIVNLVTKKQRLQCNSCGSWSSVKLEKEEA